MSDLELDDHETYVSDFWNKGGEVEKSFDNMEGFKIKSTDEDYIDLIQEIVQMIRVKESVTIVNGISFKCTRAIQKEFETDFLIEGQKVRLKFWLKKKGGTTLTVTKLSGTSSSQLVLMMRALKYMINGVLEKKISKNKLHSFVQPPGSLNHCTICGHTAKSLVGSKQHKCDVLNGSVLITECKVCHEMFSNENELKYHMYHIHKIDGHTWLCDKCNEGFPNEDEFYLHISRVHDIPPFKKAKNSESPNRVDELVVSETKKHDLIVNDTKIDESSIGSLKEGKINAAPANTVIADYVNQNCDGKVIFNVSGDGACMARAISLQLFKSEEHFYVISRAINKNILDHWDIWKVNNAMIFPFKTVAKGREIVFNNEDEYLDFLRHDDSLFLWRDNHDLNVLSDLLNTKISVVTVKTAIVTAAYEIIPRSGSYDKNNQEIVLLFTGNHYKAIMHPLVKLTKNDKLLVTLSKYISPSRRNDPKLPPIEETEPMDTTTPGSGDVNIALEGDIAHSPNIEMETDQVRQKNVQALAEQIVKRIPKVHTSCAFESEENDIMQRLVALESTIKVQNSAIRKGNDDFENLKSQNQFLYSSDKENKKALALLTEKNDNLSKEIIAVKTEMSNEIMALKSEIEKHKECTISSSNNNNNNSTSKETQNEVPSNEHDIGNDVNEKQDDNNEIKELQTLKNFKDSGYLRVNPQVEPLKKKLKCNLCEYECDLQDILERHLVCHYPKSINDNDKSETLSAQSNLKCKLCDNKFNNDNELNRHINECHIRNASESDGNHIPVLTQSLRGRDLNILNGKKIKQYNCHDCEYEGTSSKELRKHVNSTGHKNHDDLSEKCFSCNLVCLNFEDLMDHRKRSHYSIINKCRYFKEGNCKFQNSCWYSHDLSERTNNVEAQVPKTLDFQKEKESIPPDMGQNLIDLMQQIIKLMGPGKEGLTRSQGTL